jgi:hypothetical protein
MSFDIIIFRYLISVQFQIKGVTAIDGIKLERNSQLENI